MKQTDFDFGFNVRDPSNVDPWGRRTGLDEGNGNLRNKEPWNKADKQTTIDSGPISEDWLPEEVVEYVRKQITLMTNTVRKANRMLPKAGDQSAQKRQQKPQGDGIPRLNNTHLSKQPKEAKIRSVRLVTKTWNGNQSQAVSLKLAMEGHTFLWDLKLNNPNFSILQEKFGQDENDWTDQRILIYLEQDEHTEQYWPRVDFPKGTPARK